MAQEFAEQSVSKKTISTTKEVSVRSKEVLLSMNSIGFHPQIQKLEPHTNK